jgi:hypothetical protein
MISGREPILAILCNKAHGFTHALTPFGWDDKPRSSVYAFRTSSMHYKDPAVSVRVTRLWKHTETSMHQSSQKGKWNDAPMVALTSLRMWHLLRTGQNTGQAPWAFDRMDMCAIPLLTSRSVTLRAWAIVPIYKDFSTYFGRNKLTKTERTLLWAQIWNNSITKL